MWALANIHRFVLLCSLCIFQCCRCLPANYEEDAGGLDNRTWQAPPRNSGLHRLTEGFSHQSYRRSKSIVNLGSGAANKHKMYQTCIASGNRTGHCKHFSECVLDDFRPNFERIADYMCIIEQTYIGMCCPDGNVMGRSEKTFNDDDLAGVLPAIANVDDDDDDDHDKQEWNETVSKNEDDNGSPVDEKSLNGTTWRKGATSEDKDEEATRNPRRPRGCGTTTKTKTRIAGGRPADPKEWPWMAALLRKSATQFCGGVLITDRHVLTAAHCVYGHRPRDIIVRLGEYDFTTPDETRALDFRVTEIRMHRDFVYTTYENDIAIIKIHQPTVFNSYIWPVCLPPVQQSFENKNAVVTGWGTQYYGGPVSTVLLETTVPVWPQKKCVHSFTQDVPDTALCAGAFEGGRDACQGDSGGPLLHQLSNGRWVNIGIVSWGIRCGEPGLPGIYTRVSAYLDWIFANAVF